MTGLVGCTSLTSHRADGTFRGSLNARVCYDLALMVSYCCLGNRADIVRPSVEHIRVVRRQHGGRCTNDRAESIVELLGLGLVDGGLERGAGGGFGRVEAGDVGVLVEVVVVVGRCAYNGALIALVGRFDAIVWRAYCLTIDVQVDLRVVGREDAVGGPDDWAGSHLVCCCAVYNLCVCA